MWKYQIDLKRIYNICNNEKKEEKIIVNKLGLRANTFKRQISYAKLEALRNKGFLRRFQKNKIIYWEITFFGRIALNKLFNIDCLTNEDIVNISKTYLKGIDPIKQLRMQGTK